MATLSVGGTTIFDGSALQSGVTGSPTLNLGNATFPSGSVIQCVAGPSTFHTLVSSTQAKLHETSITLKQANSDIYVEVGTSIGLFTSYTDIDIALAVGWKATSTSTSSSDYTSVHLKTNWGRENVTGLGAYYVQDTSWTGGTGGELSHVDKNWSGIIDLGTNVVDTVIYISHWCSTVGSQYFGGPGNSSNNEGKESYINIMEIAR